MSLYRESVLFVEFMMRRMWCGENIRREFFPATPRDWGSPWIDDAGYCLDSEVES